MTYLILIILYISNLKEKEKNMNKVIEGIKSKLIEGIKNYVDLLNKSLIIRVPFYILAIMFMMDLSGIINSFRMLIHYNWFDIEFTHWKNLITGLFEAPAFTYVIYRLFYVWGKKTQDVKWIKNG